MKTKSSQLIMLWLLPVIVVGGVFMPALGYLVVAMVAFFPALSLSRPRFWCWNLCPRGSFLDVLLARVSLQRPVPRLFHRQWFRWVVFALLLAFMTYRLSTSGGSWRAVGGVFVGMCVLTTVIAFVLGIATRHRAWCMICPMGNLQEQVGKIGKTGTRQ